MLTEQQKDIISQTVPALEQHGDDIAKCMYKRMFTHNPELLDYFNQAHQAKGTQQRALAAAVLSYAKYLDHPEGLGSQAVMGDSIELIAQKHVSLTIMPEHYPIVGGHLLAALGEVLGDAATDEIIDAWGAAYQELADMFMAREKNIYDTHEQQQGWRTKRNFVVHRRVQESDNIVSLYMQPADGAPLAAHEPGQFIGIHRRMPDGSHVIRNYSLSNAPGTDHFRISVKREPARSEDTPPGVFSNHLHEHIAEGEHVTLTPPCGNFTLELPANENKPVMFIAGGVGVTPLMSMLHAALEQSSSKRPIVFLQGALNSKVRAFGDELDELQRQYPNLNVHVRYSEPLPQDKVGETHDSEGFFDADLIQSLVDGLEASYYFCGPAPMLALVNKLLAERGVASRNRHYEFFGPAEAMAA